MLGAALGGAMADHLGWRWEFGVQVPFILLCLVLAIYAVPGDLGIYDNRKEGLLEAMRAFDFKGSILMAVSATFLILGLVSSCPCYLWKTRSVADELEPGRQHPTV